MVCPKCGKFLLATIYSTLYRGWKHNCPCGYEDGPFAPSLSGLVVTEQADVEDSLFEVIESFQRIMVKCGNCQGHVQVLRSLLVPGYFVGCIECGYTSGPAFQSEEGARNHLWHITGDPSVLEPSTEPDPPGSTWRTRPGLL